MTDAQVSHRLPIERVTLETERLRLRPYTLADADDVTSLLNNYEIAKNTLLIPFPYETQMAIEWFSRQQSLYDAGESMAMALTLRDSGTLIGGMGLHFDWTHEHAEMGYWLGQDYWGKGYATEATSAMVKYGFEVLNLHRIAAAHFVANPASGRVMEKVGMTYEGYQRGQYKRFGEFVDVKLYGMLRSDWLERHQK